MKCVCLSVVCLFSIVLSALLINCIETLLKTLPCPHACVQEHLNNFSDQKRALLILENKLQAILETKRGSKSGINERGENYRIGSTIENCC